MTALLDRPTAVRPRTFADITPNWFATIMGTGIVATAAASLPVHLAGLRAFATVVWVLAAVLLVVVGAATARYWIHDRTRAATHHRDPVMAHFWGAPPMAMLTVGAGALLLGPDVIGSRAAVDLDWVLWSAGTITGLWTAVAIPYLQFIRFGEAGHRAFGGWLMPVVPPMVSASTGALLVPHAPSGQARLSLVLGCYALFGLSLLASVVVITLIWSRLAHGDVGPARLVPTLWIVLGPLGQSVTAVGLLGGLAAHALGGPFARPMRALALLYGVPVWGFAMMWLALAAAITVRTARTGLPFSLTWWSFTFPLGTCVTGTSQLAAHSGATLFRVVAVVLYAGLLTAWLTVGARTLRGVVDGSLLRA